MCKNTFTPALRKAGTRDTTLLLALRRGSWLQICHKFTELVKNDSFRSSCADSKAGGHQCLPSQLALTWPQLLWEYLRNFTNRDDAPSVYASLEPCRRIPSYAYIYRHVDACTYEKSIMILG